MLSLRRSLLRIVCVFAIVYLGLGDDELYQTRTYNASDAYFPQAIDPRGQLVTISYTPDVPLKASPSTAILLDIADNAGRRRSYAVIPSSRGRCIDLGDAVELPADACSFSRGQHAITFQIGGLSTTREEYDPDDYVAILVLDVEEYVTMRPMPSAVAKKVLGKLNYQPTNGFPEGSRNTVSVIGRGITVNVVVLETYEQFFISSRLALGAHKAVPGRGCPAGTAPCGHTCVRTCRACGPPRFCMCFPSGFTTSAGTFVPGPVCPRHSGWDEGSTSITGGAVAGGDHSTEHDTDLY